MIDPNEAVTTWLKADAGVAALVGANVFSPVLPEGFSAMAGRKCLVVKARGGSTHGEIPPLLMPSVAIEAWAFAPDDAKAIYGACHDVMHGANGVDLGAAGYVVWCQEEVAGQDILDTNTHWFQTIGYFRLMLRAQGA